MSRLITTAGQLVLAVLATACAPRVPSEFPRASPVVLSAENQAPLAPVAVALEEDPPLPGERADGWVGLQPASDAKPAAHDHSHHHPAVKQP